jgi:hypothetical protein
MKAIELNAFIFLILCIIVPILTSEDRKTMKLQEIQNILDTRNPNCVAYRDAVNVYFREIVPYRKCQLKCNNSDKEYALSFENWYIPNEMPLISSNCEKMLDNLNYKFDSDEMFGRKFYDIMLDAEIFLSIIINKSYLTFCI